MLELAEGYEPVFTTGKIAADKTMIADQQNLGAELNHAFTPAEMPFPVDAMQGFFFFYIENFKSRQFKI